MMDKRKDILCFAALSLCALLAFSSCAKEEQTAEPETPRQPLTGSVAQQVLVKFEPYVADMLEKNGLVSTRSSMLGLDEVMTLIEGCSIERIFPVDAACEERTREAGLHLWYVVGFDADIPVEEAVERLSRIGEVQAASPNRTLKRSYNTDSKAVPLSAQAVRKMMAVSMAGGSVFNDPLLPRQWHIINRGDLLDKSVVGSDVQCENAWQMSTGDPSIIVAVLDEGVCVEHPDLKANMWHNEGEVYRSHEDNDGNGYKGDYYGYNFVYDTGIISWDHIYDSGHATHVAGVIAAQNNNGEGVSSIAGGTPYAPGVKIMSCQIFAGGAAGNTVMMARAIKYATDNGAVVLQCSFGYTSGRANAYEWGVDGFRDQEEWETYCPLEKEAFEYFCHNAGSPDGPVSGGIAVFASGNESAPAAGFPGAASAHVSVAATAADYTPAVYSNYGDGTTISAPGGDQNYYYEYGGPGDPDGLEYGELGCVLSTLPYNISESGYGYMEGTSMACPHVSGVVALGLSYAMQLRKHFTADEIKELLYASATPIDDYFSGIKQYYRYVADVGKNQMMQMSLSAYRNKMGAGQVNAERFLKAIEGGGRPVQFPNLYVSEGGDVTVVPGNYFRNGETLTFTMDISDASVASCTYEGKRIRVHGIKEGTASALIRASDGTKQSFVITVRKGAHDSGWL